jgi:tetratricopeptide (TPR) repeat protein
MIRKVYLFWSHYEVPQIEHFGYFRRYSLPLAGPVLAFGIVAPLGLVGTVLALRDARRWALPLAFVISFSASVILFFVLDRYRMPIVPVLLLFAGLAVLEAVRAVRAARWPRVAAIAAGSALLGLFLGSNVLAIDENKAIAQIVYRLGIVEDSRGRWDDAIAHYREALRLKPGYDKALLNLAGDLARVGKADEAMETFRLAQEANPTYYRVPYNWGALHEELGRMRDAEAAYRRTVELEPRYLLGRTAFAEMLFVRGAIDSARAEFESVLAYDGRWQSEQNPTAKARAARTLAYLAEVPSRPGASDCFAASETFRAAELARLRGRSDEAIGHWKSYFEAGGACADAYYALGLLLAERDELDGAEDAFQRALRADPKTKGVHRDLGRLAAVRGDAAGAVRELEHELAAYPDDPSTLLEMGLVHERLREDSTEAARWFARYEKAGGDPGMMAARRRTGRTP